MTRRRQRRRGLLAGLGALLVLAVAVGLVVTRPWASASGNAVSAVRYLGVYEPDAPGSYTGIDDFAGKIGRQPNLVSYYSPWGQPFQRSFAASAQARGALTLVNMDPKGISLASIAAGRSDPYLRSFAGQIKAFGRPVVVSFGHEMNGYWYSWGNSHTSAATFVQAWRHVVTVVRATGATNVTWLWAVNVIQDEKVPQIPNPAPWWPGNPYVDWVGIDGYYDSSGAGFGQVFGSTIVDVRQLTATKPIIIAETGAVSTAGQQATVTDLFAGVRTYGLLGFLWFDEDYSGSNWRITSPTVFATFRQQARSFFRPATSLPQAPSSP